MGCKKILADNLKYLMVRDAISSQELASALGVCPSSVSRWVGAASLPSANSIDEIGRSFGWSAAELFGVEDAFRRDVTLPEALGAVFTALGYEPGPLPPKKNLRRSTKSSP